MAGRIIIWFFVLGESYCLILLSGLSLNQSRNTCAASNGKLNQKAAEKITFVIDSLEKTPKCGPGEWVQVISLNLTDPEQTCPTPWVLETSPARSCAGVNESCASVIYDIPGVLYEKVCGMALGYATESPDAYQFGNRGIDAAYLDGVSITHGQPRQHIWSLAAGHSDTVYPAHRCPCDNSDRKEAPLPPSFVGENYFCDSNHINGPIWDGKGCTTSCCSFHSPPWFEAVLPAPTSDQIEIRICTDQEARDEKIYLSTLLLFVQ